MGSQMCDSLAGETTDHVPLNDYTAQRRHAYHGCGRGHSWPALSYCACSNLITMATEEVRGDR